MIKKITVDEQEYLLTFNMKSMLPLSEIDFNVVESKKNPFAMALITFQMFKVWITTLNKLSDEEVETIMTKYIAEKDITIFDLFETMQEILEKQGFFPKQGTSEVTKKAKK